MKAIDMVYYSTVEVEVISEKRCIIDFTSDSVWVQIGSFKFEIQLVDIEYDLYKFKYAHSFAVPHWEHTRILQDIAEGQKHGAKNIIALIETTEVAKILFDDPMYRDRELNHEFLTDYVKIVMDGETRYFRLVVLDKPLLVYEAGGDAYKNIISELFSEQD